jgi:hypothetical protein
MGQVVDFYAAAWPNFTPALTIMQEKSTANRMLLKTLALPPRS